MGTQISQLSTEFTRTLARVKTNFQQISSTNLLFFFSRQNLTCHCHCHLHRTLCFALFQRYSMSE